MVTAQYTMLQFVVKYLGFKLDILPRQTFENITYFTGQTFLKNMKIANLKYLREKLNWQYKIFW